MFVELIDEKGKSHQVNPGSVAEIRHVDSYGLPKCCVALMSGDKFYVAKDYKEVTKMLGGK